VGTCLCKSQIGCGFVGVLLTNNSGPKDVIAVDRKWTVSSCRIFSVFGGVMEIRDLVSSDAWEYENAFYWFSDPSRLLKSLAHFELYKMISGLPGHFLELGVYKAASLIRFATFRHLLEAERSRKIIGFDVFGEFPRNKGNIDSDSVFIDRFELAGGDGLSLQETLDIIQGKGFSNIDLIQGDILETLPKFLSDHPEYRFSALHLDMDVYLPTRFALDVLWERVVPGGIVIFDDFGSVEGATKAIEEFLYERGLSIAKLPHYSVPAFVCK